MTPDAVEQVAAALDAVSRGGARLDHLPEGCDPRSPAEALAVQERVVALSRQAVAGWKVARMGETVVWGVIYAEDVHETPTHVPASRYPLRGVEAEIAFRFKTDFRRGSEPASPKQVAGLLEPVPVLEIVDSRFADYRATPPVHRLCDRMSNGGLITGSWNPTPPRDFVSMVVRVCCDGSVIFEGAGGHPQRDPLLPALEFIAVEHPHRDFRAGQIITTGTLSGLIFGSTGESYCADFGGRGQAEVTFTQLD